MKFSITKNADGTFSLTSKDGQTLETFATIQAAARRNVELVLAERPAVSRRSRKLGQDPHHGQRHSASLAGRRY